MSNDIELQRYMDYKIQDPATFLETICLLSLLPPIVLNNLFDINYLYVMNASTLCIPVFPDS